MMTMTARKCGICNESGHNRRRCLKKTTKGKIIFNYTPLVSYILEFIVTRNSYKELYDLSNVSKIFQKSVHFITRELFEIENEYFMNSRGDCISRIQYTSKIPSVMVLDERKRDEEYYLNYLFSNRTFKYIQSVSQIRKLDMNYKWACASEKQMISTGFKHACSLTQLTHLNLSYNNKLPKNVLSYFRKNINLQYLNISQCAKIKNESLSYLEYFPNLTYLNLRGIKITNLNFLIHCPKLKILKLQNTHITDNNLVNLKSCPNLEALSFSDCPKITTKGFNHLCCLSSLKKFHVLYAPLIDNDVMLYLKTLPSLNHLIMELCKNVTDMSSLNHVGELYRELWYGQDREAWYGQDQEFSEYQEYHRVIL